MAPREFNVVLRTTTDEFNVLPMQDLETEKVVSSISGSVGYYHIGYIISHVHGANDYLSPSNVVAIGRADLRNEVGLLRPGPRGPKDV